MSPARFSLLLISLFLTTTALAGKQTMPPLPPPPTEPVVFHEGTDIYGCGEGAPVHLASELIAFDKQHKYKGVIDYEEYKSARMLSDWIVDVPPRLPRNGVITARVAVSVQGVVKDFILECSADSALNEVLSVAVKRAKFRPAIHKGIAIDSIETISLHARHK